MATNEPTPVRRVPFLAVALYYGTYGLIIGIIALTLFLAWPQITATFQARLSGQSAAPQATAPAGNVGGQAPPSVRGNNPDPVPPAAQDAPDVQRSIDQYNATATAQYNAAVSAPAVPTAIPAPLPLNSAGQPVIDPVQQQQLDMSAQMAADEQQAALRAQQLAVAASRPPDVSKEDAEAMMHRDLCHVPRADPHTCAQGLYKPTPIGGE